MRLYASGLRKLGRRLATWVTFGLLAGLLVLILIAVGATSDRAGANTAQRAAALGLITFPGAYDSILSFILGLGGLFGVVYGAAIAGSEWTWGTLKNAVARGESRARYVLLSFASIAVVIALGLLFAFVTGVAAALVAAGLANVPTSGLNDAATLGRLPGHLLKGWLAITEEAALGFAIATLARSQLAGIGAGIAFYFGETFAGIFLPDVDRVAIDRWARLRAGEGGIPVHEHARRVMAPDPEVLDVEAHGRNEDVHHVSEHARRLGYARWVGAKTRDDVLDRDQLELSIRPRGVDQALGLRGVDPEIVDQLLVEVVIAHDPERGMRDAAGDDPVPGAIHVAQLVSRGRRRVDVMEPGRHLPHDGQLILPRSRRNDVGAKGDHANDRQEDREPDSCGHGSVPSPDETPRPTRSPLVTAGRMAPLIPVETGGALRVPSSSR